MKPDDLNDMVSADEEANVLTPDNPHLSQLINGSLDDPDSLSENDRDGQVEDQSPPDSIPILASTCKMGVLDPVPDDVAALVEASIADNTRRAYRSDLAHFVARGGTLPAEPALVASYLAAHAETLSVATLVRRIATISKAHEARGLPNPCRSEIVRAHCAASSARGGSLSAKLSRCCERTCFGFWMPWARV